MSIDDIRVLSNPGIGSVYRTGYLSRKQTSRPSSALATSLPDAAVISPEVRLAGLRESFMGGAGADGVITGDETRRWRDQNITKVEQILRKTTSDLGVSCRNRIQIDVDSAGNIIVMGNLSDRDRQALQEALQNYKEFRSCYGAASSAATLLRAGESASGFYKAYADNPAAAVARYRWLFDKEWDFSLYFIHGRASFTVE